MSSAMALKRFAVALEQFALSLTTARLRLAFARLLVEFGLCVLTSALRTSLSYECLRVAIAHLFATLLRLQ